MRRLNIGGTWIDLLRYSKSLSDRFTKVARKLTEWKSTGRFELPPDDSERCPKCGDKLRYAGEVCPKCIDRRAVAKRIWELVRPHRYATLGLFAEWAGAAGATKANVA